MAFYIKSMNFVRKRQSDKFLYVVLDNFIVHK
jgi:hypothetical protein